MSDDGQPTSNAVPFPRATGASPPPPLDLGSEFAAPPSGYGGFGAPFANEADIMAQVQSAQAAAAAIPEDDENEPVMHSQAGMRHPDDPVRIPAWPYYTPGAESILAERATETGIRENWNTFPLDAPIEAVLARTKLAGTYYITPLSAAGEPLIQPNQANRITIPEGHPFLASLRDQNAGGGGTFGGFGMPGFGPAGYPGFYPGFAPPPAAGMEAMPFLQVLEARDQRTLQERAMERGLQQQRDAQLRQAELDLQRREREAADLAANRTAMLMDTAMQKSIATAEAGHKASLELLKGGYEGITALQQTTVQAERNRLDAAQAAAEAAAERRERAYREDMARRDQLAREEQSRRDAFERDERERRERREREDRAEREAAAQREREREREFRAEMARLQAAQSPLAMLTAIAGIVPPVLKAASDAGIDFGGIIETVTGAGSAKGTVEVIGDVLIEGLRTLRGLPPSSAGEIEEVEELVDGEGRVLEQRVRRVPATAPTSAPRQIPQQAPTQIPAAGPAPMPAGMAQPPPVQVAPTPAPFAPEGFAAPPPFAAAPTPSGPAPASVQPSPGLDGPTKTRARRAIISLVEQLQGADPSTWLPTLAIHMNHPDSAAVGQYLRAFTIRVALTEAGAPPPLVEQFIQLLDANSLVPDVPRG